MTSAESLPIDLIHSHGFQHPICTAGISCTVGQAFLPDLRATFSNALEIAAQETEVFETLHTQHVHTYPYSFFTCQVLLHYYIPYWG